LARSRSSGMNPATWTAVHLLSAEEVKSLFRDVVEGLGFLVGLVHPPLGHKLTRNTSMTSRSYTST
jgi:hypothetical protein